MGFPSMRDYFEPAPYEGIEKIINYLANGKPTFATAGHPIDCFTGEKIGGFENGMTDGEYSWISSLAYYVKTYNLRLPEEFENKVLAFDA